MKTGHTRAAKEALSHLTHSGHHSHARSRAALASLWEGAVSLPPSLARTTQHGCLALAQTSPLEQNTRTHHFSE